MFCLSAFSGWLGMAAGRFAARYSSGPLGG